MKVAPSIKEQADAVARAACNLHGHVDNLRAYVQQRKRSQMELDVAVQWLPALEAAAETMRQLANSEPQKTGVA